MRLLMWMVALFATAVLSRLCLAAARRAGERTPLGTALPRALTDARAAPAAYWVLGVIVIACLAPWLSPYDPDRPLDVIALKNVAPTALHLFGTDPVSRDVLSRVIYGSRISLTIALLAMTLSVSVGTAYGAVAGYFGGFRESALMRLNDAALAVPRVLLLIVLLALWGSLPLWALIAVLGLTGWFGISRLVRAEVLTLREREMVLAVRALGASDWRILTRYILPNILAPVIVAASLGVGNVIVLEAGLSYLGIGVRPPTASWGGIIQDGREAVAQCWWLSLFPGLAILLTVMAFNRLGDALHEALDPRQATR